MLPLAASAGLCNGSNNGATIGFVTVGSPQGCGGYSQNYALVCSGVNSLTMVPFGPPRREPECMAPPI